MYKPYLAVLGFFCCTLQGQACQTGFLFPLLYHPNMVHRTVLTSQWQGPRHLIHSVANDVLEDPSHHVHIVGGAQSGKTHFMALVYYRLKDQYPFTGVLPIWMRAGHFGDDWYTFTRFLGALISEPELAHASVPTFSRLEYDPETHVELLYYWLHDYVQDRRIRVVVFVDNVERIWIPLMEMGAQMGMGLLAKHIPLTWVMSGRNHLRRDSNFSGLRTKRFHPPLFVMQDSVRTEAYSDVIKADRRTPEVCDLMIRMAFQYHNSALLRRILVALGIASYPLDSDELNGHAWIAPDEDMDSALNYLSLQGLVGQEKHTGRWYITDSALALWFHYFGTGYSFPK